MRALIILMFEWTSRSVRMNSEPESRRESVHQCYWQIQLNAGHVESLSKPNGQGSTRPETNNLLRVGWKPCEEREEEDVASWEFEPIHSSNRKSCDFHIVSIIRRKRNRRWSPPTERVDLCFGSDRMPGHRGQKQVAVFLSRERSNASDPSRTRFYISTCKQTANVLVHSVKGLL